MNMVLKNLAARSWEAAGTEFYWFNDRETLDKAAGLARKTYAPRWCVTYALILEIVARFT